MAPASVEVFRWKNWKKGAWHAILARFNAKTEFGYCGNGDRVNARCNAQIRAKYSFLRDSSRTKWLKIYGI